MSDLMDLKEQIKNTVTMDDVCERLGIHVPSNRKIRSIYKDEHTPSMHLYKADYYDYATGQGGDVIRFVMDHQGWDFKKAVRWLAGQANTLDVRTRQREVKAREPSDLTDDFLWHKDNPTDPDPAWQQVTSERWGLTMGQIRGYGSVFTGNMLLTPHWHDGKVRGIKRRFLDGRKDSFEGSQFTHGLYVPKHTACPAGEGQFVHIVEGESDCWVLTEVTKGTDAVVYGLPSGAGLWRDEWRKAIGDAYGVGLWFDDDDAGRAARERVAGSILTVRDRVEHFYPRGGRVAELYIAAGAAFWTHVDQDTQARPFYDSEG